MIHNIVIELDLVPMREDGLERRTSTLSSFCPRNRYELVRVYEGIGVLCRVQKSQRGWSTQFFFFYREHVQDRRCSANMHL